jgi:hypothetical protein
MRADLELLNISGCVRAGNIGFAGSVGNACAGYGYGYGLNKNCINRKISCDGTPVGRSAHVLCGQQKFDSFPIAFLLTILCFNSNSLFIKRFDYFNTLLIESIRFSNTD